jgi:drug/metabolite transporter (DMT)-like permease
VVLIVQPEFLFGSNSTGRLPVPHFEFYILLMVFAAVMYACNMVLIHIVSKQIPPMCNLHQSNLGFILASAVLCSFLPNPVEASQVDVPLVARLAGIVGTGLLTQFCIIKANTIATPSVVGPFGYVSVAVGFLADVFLFNTKFTLLAVLGIVLTSAGLLAEYLNARFKEPPQPPNG